MNTCVVFNFWLLWTALLSTLHAGYLFESLLIVVLICISLITKDAEHLYTLFLDKGFKAFVYF